MADTSLGFKYEGRLSGQPDLIADFTFKDTETLTKGDLVNLETGEVDLAATGDTALCGVVMETLSGTDSTTKIKVAYASDAIFSVYDATARAAGATLDISGATGAMTITTSSNADVIVVAPSSATERTLLTFNGTHYLQV